MQVLLGSEGSNCHLTPQLPMASLLGTDDNMLSTQQDGALEIPFLTKHTSHHVIAELLLGLVFSNSMLINVPQLQPLLHKV